MQTEQTTTITVDQTTTITVDQLGGLLSGAGIETAKDLRMKIRVSKGVQLLELRWTSPTKIPVVKGSP